jgi:glycosyltransferase involved in cell wall biosynthesis
METKEVQATKQVESAKADGIEATANLTPNSLTIVIPALNEEEAIAGTISRCLAARDRIKEAAGLADVEVIVVSDGSTDGTAKIAQGFEEVKVIVFEQNRGYGAAIKEGFRQGKGSLVGFLDADGTCDPEYFAEMCRAVVEDSADIVLGSRMGPDSKMPRVRRLGNRVYAFILGLLCGQHVTDTASGMRVIRRQSLKHLYPLPDGLHFTPSMSARAMLNGLHVIEFPMRYEERIGRSKLSVLKDGARFLRAIFAGVLCYRPERLLLMGFSTCLLLILLLAAYPAEFYYEHRRLEEWMIYRFMACYLIGSFGLLLLLATALVNRMAHFSRRRPEGNSFWSAIVASLFRGPSLVVLVAVLVAAAVASLWPGIGEYLTTGHVSLHWSRLLAGSFALFSALQTAIFALLMKVVSIWQEQRAEQVGRGAEDATGRGWA